MQKSTAIAIAKVAAWAQGSPPEVETPPQGVSASTQAR